MFVILNDYWPILVISDQEVGEENLLRATDGNAVTMISDVLVPYPQDISKCEDGQNLEVGSFKLDNENTMVSFCILVMEESDAFFELW